MALQARAEATRRKILDSAVELFAERGYGETGLADVLQRAGVSKGAFYYHFDSKEAVATAIIEEFSGKTRTLVLDQLDRAAPELEGVIRSTFIAAALISSESAARVGHELLQALRQISTVASQTYRDWTEDFVGVIARTIEPWAKDRGVDANDVAEGIWMGVLGCHLLSTALSDDHFARLSRSWKLVVRSLAPVDEVDAYSAMIDDIATSYTATSYTATV
jgi:AcrR family transcriptional regulator